MRCTIPRAVVRLIIPAGFILSGCATTPPAKQTGFLSDYSKLEAVNENRMVYRSPNLREYKEYIVDPIEFRLPPQKLDAQQRAEVAKHFRKKLTEVLEKRGYKIVEDPGVGVARIQIALTDVASSTWWMKLHPAARASGAGTGGAAMEGEVTDSVTGEQLGAVVQAAPGNQFNFTAFTTVADVNSAIDKWADQFGQRLDELRKQAS